MKYEARFGRNVFYMLCLLLLCSCGTSRPYYKSDYISTETADDSKQVASSIFLIGDTGEPDMDGALNVMSSLDYQLELAGDSSAVIFLGDNIYPDGMPPKNHKSRAEAEASMKPALDMLQGYAGKSFFIPGNHDWRYGREGVKAQEQFVENYGNGQVQFLPDNGCPGPDGLTVGDDWFVITFDSEWWINRSFASDIDTTGCAVTSRDAVIDRVEHLVESNSDRHILLAFHHPLYSNGTHGGHFSVTDHLFPLTSLVDGLYLPIPILGSLYPLSRKMGISGQDISNKRYELFKKEILEAIEDHEVNFLAGGHEHNLSFYEKEKENISKEGTNYFIVSGSGSKRSYARRGYGAEFVYSHKGFSKLVSYTDGSVAVEFWIPDKQKPEGKRVYSRQLVAPSSSPASEINADEEGSSHATEDTIESVAPGPGYAAGDFKRFMWGDHYRDAWTTKVEVPVLDLKKEKGGLRVLAKTGGVQTVTIIAQDSSGRKYVIRSVQKNPRKSLPKALQETFVTNIAQDQTSASHPYGGLIVPPLARAAGVYQNTPELRFIPENSPLNISATAGNTAGTLVTMEEFVSSAWFNKTFSKSASQVVDSDELWDLLRSGTLATVDQRQLVRSRIFDMYIGDWDRHEGQWFWTKTQTDSLPTYQPIPIDRDNAFYKSDGLIMGLARMMIFPKFQLFDDGIQNIKGINLNAQHFDRWFMNGLSRKEWVGIAEDMQASLTDSIITSSVEQWPEEIIGLNGTSFVEKLKARREKLPEFARRYYDLLSRTVNVYGSEKEESFVVRRKPNGETLVEVYRVGGDKEKKKIYDRQFWAHETKEIRLYGFGGADHFDVDGRVDKAIKMRIIGGQGADTIRDQSTVLGWGKKTLWYDTPRESGISSMGEVKDKSSSNPRINRYERRSFQYNFLGPLIASGYNENDGVFVGGGVHIQRHGFRKQPFASDHRVTGKMATLTSSFTFNYEGVFTEQIGRYDLGVQVGIRGPNYSSNFFGLGNESSRSRDDNDFYGYPYDNVDASVKLAEWYNELLQVRVGGGYEYLRPLSVDNRFVTTEEAQLPSTIFNPHHFATVHAGVKVSAVDNKLFPRYGYKFELLSELKVGLNDRSKTFNRLSSQTSLYYTFRSITTTLATRVGFATNIGDFNFFQANTLGGQTFTGNSGNLRGYMRDRFSGKTSLFQNTELRTKLFNINSYYLPATMGIRGFVDEGRVWVDNESSTRWHFGYGGGLWISPLKRAILTAGYALSRENGLFTVSLGFTF